MEKLSIRIWIPHYIAKLLRVYFYAGEVPEYTMGRKLIKNV